MPRVYVEWVAGRGDAQRKELARRITDAVVDVATVRPEQVQIVFREYPATHYFRGGMMWTDIVARERAGT